MPVVPSHPTFPWSEEFLRTLGEDKYRVAYLEDQVRSNIAFQIRALRDQRGWTQTNLAEKAGKSANAISRLEDPDYGKVTLTTLLEIATALDLALLVQFVEHDDWLTRMADVSPQALQKRSFNLERLLSLALATRHEHPHPQHPPRPKSINALGGDYHRFVPSQLLPHRPRQDDRIEAALSNSTPNKDRAFL